MPYQDFMISFYRINQVDVCSKCQGHFEKGPKQKLIGINKFLVTFRDDEETKRQLMKLGVQHSMSDKGWICNAEIYSNIIEQFQSKFIIREVPDFVYRCLDIQGTKCKDTIPGIWNRLSEFQRFGIQFGIKSQGRIILSDEMGTGKSIQSLGIAYHYKEHWPLLIICPTSLKFFWKDEIQKWFPEVQNVSMFNSLHHHGEEKSDVYILPFDHIPRSISKLENSKFQIIIVDEAHFLKHYKTNRAQILTPILESSRHIILIAGGDLTRRPCDLFPFFRIIRPDIFKYFKDFGNRYCNPKASKFAYQKIDYTGKSCLRELNFIMSKGLLLRRLKKDILGQLPVKKRKKIVLKVDQNILKGINEIIHDNKIESLEKLVDLNQQLKDNLYQEIFEKCFLLTGKAKLQGIINFIEQTLENQTKLVVYLYHLELMIKISQYFTQKDIEYIQIIGETEATRRQALLKEFQESSLLQVALIIIAIPTIGLNLSANYTIVFAELSKNINHLFSCEENTHNSKAANCIYLVFQIGKNTLDEQLFNNLEDQCQLKLTQPILIPKQVFPARQLTLEEEGDLLRKEIKGSNNKMTKERKNKDKLFDQNILPQDILEIERPAKQKKLKHLVNYQMIDDQRENENNMLVQLGNREKEGLPVYITSHNIISEDEQTSEQSHDYEEIVYLPVKSWLKFKNPNYLTEEELLEARCEEKRFQHIAAKKSSRREVIMKEIQKEKELLINLKKENI